MLEEKIITLSTAHISYKDSILIESETEEYWYPYEKNENGESVGWIISVTYNYYDEDLYKVVPSTIRDILKYAIEKGASWINLDRDAVPVDDLPAYEW
jgi:hypothetical protein